MIRRTVLRISILTVAVIVVAAAAGFEQQSEMRGCESNSNGGRQSSNLSCRGYGLQSKLAGQRGQPEWYCEILS